MHTRGFEDRLFLGKHASGPRFVHRSSSTAKIEKIVGTTKKRAKEERIKEKKKEKEKEKEKERDQSTSIGKLTSQIGTSSFSLATIS